MLVEHLFMTFPITLMIYSDKWNSLDLQIYTITDASYTGGILLTGWMLDINVHIYNCLYKETAITRHKNENSISCRFIMHLKVMAKWKSLHEINACHKNNNGKNADQICYKQL